LKELKISCTGADTLRIEQIEPFQGQLKELSKANYKKLRKSMEDFGFSFPFFIWRTDGRFKTIDGHQRTLTLLEMVKDGWTIPPLPVVWIHALDEKEAKVKILLAIGQYGQVTEEGLHEFMHLSEINIDYIKDTVHLPEINLGHFQQNFTSDTMANLGELGADEKKECKSCPHCGFDLSKKN
jgi:hypothetical protein